jgi:LysM repeat protein
MEERPYQPRSYEEEEYLDDLFNKRSARRQKPPRSQLFTIIAINIAVSIIISLLVLFIAGPILFSPSKGPSSGTKNTTDGTPVSAVVPPLKYLKEAGTITGTVSIKTPEKQKPASVYVVKSGDSLSSIAGQFHVTLDALMTVNGILDPNVLQVGQELAIPSADVAVVTPTYTPAPTPTITPLPFDPPTPMASGEKAASASSIEAKASPAAPSTPITPKAIALTISKVEKAGDPEGETLILHNEGAIVDLNGWSLNRGDEQIYVFSRYFYLWGNGSVNIHTAFGENSNTDLYLDRKEAAWPSGSIVILKDGSRKTISTYQVP